jgi:hypothetical protein
LAVVRITYRSAVVALVLVGAGCGGGSVASTLSSPPPTTPPATSSPTTTGNVPGRTEKVYLATAIACSKLGGESVSFTPLVVTGPGYTATIQPTNYCRELAMFNSYVYDVPMPKSGTVTITPGNQSPAELDAKKATASGAVTVYYARHGAGDYRVSVIMYKRTADVKGAD